MKLGSKVALITGGGTGIGAAIAERFVSEGAKICITGRRQDVLDQVVSRLPKGSTVACTGDVSVKSDIDKMISTALSLTGKLDILVNNAGMSVQGGVVDLEPDVWNQVIATNLTGPYLLMQATIPYMVKRGGGSIINIASVGGMRCLPGMPAYCSSKAGLIMLTKQVALDYGPQNIRCNVICPGGVQTDMTEKEFGVFGQMLNMSAEEYFKLISADIPLQRFADSSEISGLCLYLAGPDSSFMTGSALVIDGGTTVVDVVGASIMGSLRRGNVLT